MTALALVYAHGAAAGAARACALIVGAWAAWAATLADPAPPIPAAYLWAVAFVSAAQLAAEWRGGFELRQIAAAASLAVALVALAALVLNAPRSMTVAPLAGVAVSEALAFYWLAIADRVGRPT